MLGKCALCGENSKLRFSHILPKFVFSWYKRTAVSSLRTEQNPNLRIQDGEKRYLLCEECEERLNKWETPFCNKIFIPLHGPESRNDGLEYENWALKFAVSVSFRVLLYYKEIGLSHFSSRQKILADQALRIWRSFLLDQNQDIGKFEQHLLPLDVIKNHTAPQISPFINRYLLRAVHMDVISSNHSAIIYSKLFRIVIFGFIEENSENWQGTKLHFMNGIIGGIKDYHIPGPLIEFMYDKANQVMNSFSNLSQKQRGKISEIFNKNVDYLPKSEAARAIFYDFLHSGDDAFSDKRKINHNY